MMEIGLRTILIVSVWSMVQWYEFGGLAVLLITLVLLNIIRWIYHCLPYKVEKTLMRIVVWSEVWLCQHTWVLQLYL